MGEGECRLTEQEAVMSKILDTLETASLAMTIWALLSGSADITDLTEVVDEIVMDEEIY